MARKWDTDGAIPDANGGNFGCKQGGCWMQMERKMCPVDVITLCSASGEIRPLRLRVEDEAHQLLRVDIEEIVSIRQIQYVGIEATVFLCRATVGEKQWLFELRYTIRTHTWCLLRMVY